MIGLKGLQKPVTGLVAASGATCHLIEKLKRAFRCPRIAAAQSEIGVDHADKRQMREVVPFGDKLGANNNIEGAIGDFLQLAP